MSFYGSIEQVKTRTGVTSDDLGKSSESEVDSFIENLLKRSSSEINSYCRRKFFLKNDVEIVREGNGRSEMSLGYYPLVAVKDIQVDGESISADWRIPKIEGTSRNSGRVSLDGSRFWKHNKYKFVIDYGFSDDTRPEVISSVAEDIAVTVINEAVAERTSRGAKSISMDGYSVSYDIVSVQDKIQLSENMKQRLKPFKKVVVA